MLGGHISRTSGLLGKDVVLLSKLLGDNIKMSAKVSVGDARSERVSATGEDPASGKKAGQQATKRQQVANENAEKGQASTGSQNKKKEDGRSTR